MADLVNGLGGSAGFGEGSVAATDDGSSALIDITGVFGGNLNFFGNSFGGLYVNNNGNITFNSTLSAFTPFGISNSSIPIIAAYFGDVDTRGGAVTASTGGNSTGSNLVYYDLDTTNGIFTATWDDVGYFNRKTNKLNAFQIELASTGGNGNFDITFRYENIDWTTGDFSGGSNGLGGTVAKAGFSAGDNTSFFEMSESGNQQNMLDLDQQGIYQFSVKNGTTGAVDETIDGSDGIDDILSLEDGNDTSNGLGGDDFLYGGNGNDTLRGGGGNDKIYGGASNDILYGGTGDDKIYGGDGNDALYGDAGTDVIDGGNGTADAITYRSSSAGVTVSLTTGLGTGGDAEGDTLTGIERLYGSQHNDVLTGDANSNYLYGYNGTDNITGLAGNDFIIAGDGDDTVDAGDNDDTVYGDAGADTLNGGNGDKDTLTYIKSLAAVTVSLGAGTGSVGDANGDNISNFERLYGSNYDDTLSGDNNSNILNGYDGNDTINGLDGIDFINGGNGNDTINGGDGDDTIYCDAGNDAIDGGNGIKDTVIYLKSTAGVNVSFTTGLGTGGDAQGDTFANMERLYGTNFDDTLSGNASSNIINGYDGSDTINGFSGKDTIYGGNGNDTIDGGDSNDTLNGEAGTDTINGGNNDDIIDGGDDNDTLNGDAGNDTLYGKSGDDTINGGDNNDTIYGDAGSDIINGGNGTQDIVNYSSSGSAVTVSLTSGTGSGGDAAGDTISNIEIIYGSGFNDTLTGDSLQNTLYGGIGVDFLYGMDNDDIMYGEGSNDILFAGNGNDTLYGGTNQDVLIGEDGNDTLYGNDDVDAFSGGTGDDTIYGGNANDTITGGAGADSLYGDAGSDTFVYSSAGDSTDSGYDILYAFSNGEDKIQIDGLIAEAINELTLTIDGNFTFIDDNDSDFYLRVENTTITASDFNFIVI